MSSPSAASPTPLRVLVTFPLPPPSLALLQNNPAYAGTPLEVITAEGDMEVVENFHAALKQFAPIDGLICRPGNTIDKAALDLCGPRLRAISSYSVGFNHVDIPETQARGILVGHWSERETLAEDSHSREAA